ncbi:unnamed protein product [Brassica oleracea]
MIRPVHNTAKYVPPPNPSGCAHTAPLWDGVCVASGNSLVTILEEEEEKNPKLLLVYCWWDTLDMNFQRNMDQRCLR